MGKYIKYTDFNKKQFWQRVFQQIWQVGLNVTSLVIQYAISLAC